MGYRFYCGRTVTTSTNSDCNVDGSAAATTSCCVPENDGSSSLQCQGCYELDCLLQTVEPNPSDPNTDYEIRNRCDNKTRLGYDWLHSKTYKHYCGRIVGNHGYTPTLVATTGEEYCLECDGTCGPQFGCQCKECYELDQVIALRNQVLLMSNSVEEGKKDSTINTIHHQRSLLPLRNSNGAIVHVSYNKVYDERRHVAHDTEGYRFYCGRLITRYHNDCDDCDGYCGPFDGCQCMSCFRLEQEYIILSRKKHASEQMKLKMDGTETKDVVNTSHKQFDLEGVSTTIKSISNLKEYEEMTSRLKQWQTMLMHKKSLLQDLPEEVDQRIDEKPDDDSMCIICGEAVKSIVIIPCGHVCFCDQCIGRVVVETKKCPICMSRIQSQMKVFF